MEPDNESDGQASFSTVASQARDEKAIIAFSTLRVLWYSTELLVFIQSISDQQGARFHQEVEEQTL